MKHELKIEQQFLAALLDGSKTFEVRLNDRGYQKGDVLEFWDSDFCEFREFEVTYVHSGLGLAPSYVVLAVRKLP